MAVKIDKKIKPASNRSFLARDFEGFRQKLIQQARIYFPDKIKDFSEPSVAGMLVDIASTVGDTMSFYLDHQFKELDPFTAVELGNIQNHLVNAGIAVRGAAPSVGEVDLSFIVPSESVIEEGQTKYLPKLSCLPYVLENTFFKSNSGIFFNMTEDADFAEKDLNNKFVCKYIVHSTDGDTGVPTEFKVTKTVTVISGNESVRAFVIEDNHVPFREIALPDSDVSEIISIVDSDGDKYHEVESLSQDTVFVPVDNTSRDDFDLVPKTLEVVSAPKRYVKVSAVSSRTTRLRFGSGNSAALDDDIVPDPSDLSLDLYGRKSFSRFSIDPKSLLDTQTLGVSPRNTVLTVNYRHGGGLNHNVDAGTIKEVTSLSLEFRKSPTPSEALSTRQSASVVNQGQTRGGANPPSIEQLRSLIYSARNAQSRTVTRDDLLARIYTMPAQFGRVFRVGLADNPTNPLALMMFVLTLDRNGKLTFAPDQLKNNLSTYLNEFRLISDAIDILDAGVVNYGIDYEVYVDKTMNKQSVLTSINTRISSALDIRYFQIDQPMIIDDVVNLIINTPGVISLTDLKIYPITGVKDDREYSDFTFLFEASTKKGIIRPPLGSIFEMKYPDKDIKGIAI
mgnify:CR=1 FL=1